MRNFCLIFSITVSALVVSAEKMPLLTDTTVTTTAEILNRIQADSSVAIKSKYSDLQKNFTPNFLTTGLDLDCRTGQVTKSDVQYAGFRISNDSKKLDSGLIQSYSSVTHYDCNGRLIFSEKIKVLSPAPATLSVADATKFVRSFEVLPGEVARQYQIENATSEIVFSVNSQRVPVATGQRIYTSVEIGEQKWLEFDQLDPSINERTIYIQMHAGIFMVNGSKWRMGFNNGSMVLKTLWNSSRIEHSIDGSITSQVGFDSQLASLAIGMTSQMLGQIFSGSISKLPATQKVQAGVSDSPFLRELQLNYNRMLTNTEAEQVKVFFQKTIEDIKSGRIKVEQ